MSKIKSIIFISIGAVAFVGFGVIIIWATSRVTDTFTDVWTCGDTLTDTRDGKEYATVLIGTQCWMAKNINVGTRVNASTYPRGTDCSTALAIEKYCPEDSDANCATYGGLYEWDQAMCASTSAGAQGICPLGWHIPTHDEFTTLERAVCTSGTCATDFPYDTSTGGWRGTDEGTKLKSGGIPGFIGLVAGDSDSGSFDNLSRDRYFWSSTQSGSDAWARYLISGLASVFRGTLTKAYGSSVRCLKN